MTPIARSLGQGVSPDSPYPMGYGDESGPLIPELICMLRKRSFLILAFAAAGLLLAALYVLVKAARYEATAEIEVAPAGSNSLGLDELVSKAFSANDSAVQLQTAVQVLRSQTIATDVMTQLKMAQRRDFAGPWQQPEGRAFSAMPPTVRERLIERFHKSLTIEVVPKTEIIALHFRAVDPKLSSDAVNALVGSYRQRNFRSSYESAAEVSSWLSKQTDDLQERVRDAQEKLAALDRRTGLIGVDETDNIVLKRLEQLGEQLTAAESERIVKEARYRMAQASSPELIASPVADPSLQLLRTQQAELHVQFAQMSAKFGKNYPKLNELSNQIARVDSAVATELTNLQERYHNDYEAALHSEQMLRTSFEQEKQKAFELNEGSAQRAILKREVESTQQLYETVQLKLQQAGIAAGLASANIAVVDVAQVPSEPIEPRPGIDLLLGLGAGLTAGTITALAAEAMRDAVRTTDDAENAVALPVLAVVPQISRGPRKGMRRLKFFDRSTAMPASLVALESPHSRPAESYRMLRSSLLFGYEGGPAKVIVVTSAMPREGKTLTAMNCAVVLAQQGARVLLVDADLRRPSIHHSFNMSREPGLTSLLSHRTELEDAICRVPAMANLSVLSAGFSSEHPGEMLSSPRMQELLEGWRSQYDHVVIDTPPVSMTSDAVVLGAHADLVLIVVRSESTTRQALRRTRDVLQRNHAPLGGLILNAMNTRLRDSYTYAELPFSQHAESEYYVGPHA